MDISRGKDRDFEFGALSSLMITHPVELVYPKFCQQYRKSC